jgi:multidrug resistance efflux pump
VEHSDVRNALTLKKLKENEKSARLEARLAALNLEHTQITADMEMHNVRGNE